MAPGRALGVVTALALVAAAVGALAAPAKKPAKKPELYKPDITHSRGQSMPLNKAWEVEEREYLGTPATERAVARALAYLASAQSPDGSWQSPSYSSEAGIVGLCTLAFLSAGHQPNRGKYGQVLAKATDYIVSSAQRNGLIYNTSGSAGPPMYGHGFATLALA